MRAILSADEMRVKEITGVNNGDGELIHKRKLKGKVG